jgi:hypothetical protein
MIPDNELERLIEASERTKEQLTTIKALEGNIDGKVRAVIRQIVVKEIDEVVGQLKQRNPNVDLNSPPNDTVPFSKQAETWINGNQVVLGYRFQVITTNGDFFKRRALEGVLSSAYLPAPVFMKMTSDLRADVLKGELDQQIRSRTDSIMYARMKEVEATYIPEWRKQTEPKYQPLRYRTGAVKPRKMVSIGKLPLEK